MHIICSLQHLTPELKNAFAEGTVVTIGNYDGIHLGHQEILKKAVNIAREQFLPSILVTFEPQPREYFLTTKPNLTIDSRLKRLMSLREKVEMLKQFGLDYLLILPFDEELANLPAASFIGYILKQQLNVRYLVVGEDFAFGYKHSGDINLLKRYEATYNFKLTAMPLYILDRDRISSSLIRKYVHDGDLKTAEKMLGRPYSVTGRIIAGEKMGRTLGFPTANMHLSHKIVPLAGVYAVKVFGIAENGFLLGVANIGFRPTITAESSKRVLEFYLFDFHGDIYGKMVKVEFIHKLRDEQKFASFELLQKQIHLDIQLAKTYFAANK